MKKIFVFVLCLFFISSFGVFAKNTQKLKNPKRKRVRIVYEYCKNINPQSSICEEIKELRKEYRKKMRDLRKRLYQEILDYCKDKESEFCTTAKSRIKKRNK